MPFPFTRGVKVCCSHTVFSALAALAVSPIVVRRSCPDASPSIIKLELPGAIDVATIEPPVCSALLVLVQLSSVVVSAPYESGR